MLMVRFTSDFRYRGINFLGFTCATCYAAKCGFTQQKQVLPLAALFGSLLLLVSDTVGRLLPGNGEMPAGDYCCDASVRLISLFVNQNKRFVIKRIKSWVNCRCESNCHLLGLLLADFEKIV